MKKFIMILAASICIVACRSFFDNSPEAYRLENIILRDSTKYLWGTEDDFTSRRIEQAQLSEEEIQRRFFCQIGIRFVIEDLSRLDYDSNDPYYNHDIRTFQFSAKVIKGCFRSYEPYFAKLYLWINDIEYSMDKVSGDLFTGNVENYEKKIIATDLECTNIVNFDYHYELRIYHRDKYEMVYEDLGIDTRPFLKPVLMYSSIYETKNVRSMIYPQPLIFLDSYSINTNYPNGPFIEDHSFLSYKAYKEVNDLETIINLNIYETFYTRLPKLGTLLTIKNFSNNSINIDNITWEGEDMHGYDNDDINVNHPSLPIILSQCGNNFKLEYSFNDKQPWQDFYSDYYSFVILIEGRCSECTPQNFKIKIKIHMENYNTISG